MSVFTVEAAARRGLDFIAITDHNATSHYDAMRELQPYFDKLLLIPGREITTFYGHMNLLGTTGYIDFRLGSRTVPNVNTLLRRAQKLGALVSINHPDSPSGENCMGCGWTPAWPVDMHLFTSVEAVNGGSETHGETEIPFWNKELTLGYRLAGIGGSDNHDAFTPPDEPNSVGNPTTVVYATDLSTPAILAGIRAGHVFIDLTGSHNRMLTMEATANGKTAQMGDLLDAPKGAAVTFDLHVTRAEKGSAALLEDGRPLNGLKPADSTKKAENFPRHMDRRWPPALVSPAGKRAGRKALAVGNPVYLDWSAPADAIRP